MIKINLQYLAYPVWAYAIWWLIYGLYIFFSNISGVDIMPMIAISVGITSAMWSVDLAILGGLIWMAFKNKENNNVSM